MNIGNQLLIMIHLGHDALAGWRNSVRGRVEIPAVSADEAAALEAADPAAKV